MALKNPRQLDFLPYLQECEAGAEQKLPFARTTGSTSAGALFGLAWKAGAEHGMNRWSERYFGRACKDAYSVRSGETELYPSGDPSCVGPTFFDPKRA